MTKDSNKHNSINFIDEDEFENSELVEVYKESIRVIENDIESLKADHTRHGITVWGMGGAIALCTMSVFSEIRDLVVVPYHDIGMVFLTTTFFFYLVFALMKLSEGEHWVVKPFKLFSTRDTYLDLRMAFIVRWLVLFLSSIVIWQFSIPLVNKILGSISLFFPIGYLGMIIFLSFKDAKFGHNPKFTKTAKYWIIGLIISFLIFILSLGSQLTLPSKDAVSSYIIGLSLGAIIFLFERVFTSYSNKQEIKLREIRDDLIFQRVDINGAIARYQILREGESLADSIKVEYDKLNNQIRLHDVIHTNLRILVARLIDEIPKEIDTTVTRKEKRIRLKNLFTSLEELEQQSFDLQPTLQKSRNEFLDKLEQDADKSGDYITENLYKNNLDQTFKFFQKSIAEIIADKNFIATFISNPKKVLKNESPDVQNPDSEKGEGS